MYLAVRLSNGSKARSELEVRGLRIYLVLSSAPRSQTSTPIHFSPKMSPFRPARTSESFISSSPPSDPAGREAWTRLPNDSAESVLAGPLGVHPSEMVGKVLKSIRVSRSHPTVTLHFADRSAFQVRVDGYDPTHPGVPKIIETSAELGPLLAADGAEHLGYTVAHAALITMTDRAFQRGKRGGSWDQRHAGVAFKFKE